MWGIIFSNNFSGRKSGKAENLQGEEELQQDQKRAANEIFCKGGAEVSVLN